MKVPFHDMQARLASVREEILHAIIGVIDAGKFCGSDSVEAFEQEFATYCGAQHAIGVGSGTEALWLVLLALGIGPGDEVVTVSMTYAATAEAIRMTGAEPVFVDIRPDSLTMDPEALADAITARTKAVIPVHLHGRMADMAAILAVARRHGLQVVEDAAQAHGAQNHSGMAGALGDAGCFSFYPSKNLAALGDGGAIITHNGELAAKLRLLRNHGQATKNHHVAVGWNSRMDDIQAAVLRIRLKRLDSENEVRRRIAARYNQGLTGLEGVICPSRIGESDHVHHIHAIRVRDRARLMAELHRRGIGHAVHYPVPAHLQPAFAGPRHPHGSLPVTERCADELISLPMFPELTANQIERVVNAVVEITRASIAA